MTAILAVFIAKLLDPVGIIFAVGLGYLIGRGIVGVFVGAVVASVVVEIALSALQTFYSFNGATFVVGLVAYAVWSTLGAYLARRRAKHKEM
jgi:hypothetical protein